ncbi:MAG: hypothetical protein EBE86_019130 [Hormoscilla sp. GUM202]|nr:hypothetical protein [Hormoscilla sp. GUM202]
MCKMGCASIEMEKVEVLADFYRLFDLGRTRFLIAFRHPNSPNDAFCMAHLLWQAVPQAAKDRGFTLKYPVHSYFIYDRGIPIWAAVATLSYRPVIESPTTGLLRSYR